MPVLSVVLAMTCISSSATIFPAGSVVIDMGQTPQTYANTLRAYGLVYNLLKSYSVPINGVVSSTKAKDGVDFTIAGRPFKGGSYVISKLYITTAVQRVLDSSIYTGVSKYVMTSANTLDVTYTFKFSPKWVMDAANGSIAVAFLNNALIPATAYVFKGPAQLNACDDIYVMPHADPTWATHNNLLSWNLNNHGAIWAGCHAVSVLDSLQNPANTSQKMNFLTTNKPVSWTLHAGG